MTTLQHAILVGLDPEVVEYEKWPGLTPEKLRGAMAAHPGRRQYSRTAVSNCQVRRIPTTSC